MKGKPNNTINANIKMETPRRIQKHIVDLSGGHADNDR